MQTPYFSVDSSSFTVKSTTYDFYSTENPSAFFTFSVYPEGSAMSVCEGGRVGSIGSDSTVCQAGPGIFWIDVVVANLSFWRIEITQ
jgi:hypothetical protein